MPNLTIVIAILVTLRTSSHAQNTQHDFLDVHNAARKQVGIEPMTWDENVAKFARNYVNQKLSNCNLVHSNGKYGENLAKGGGDFTARAAVGLWIGEKPNYNYASNSCVGGACLHYTQVVWRNSIKLGCARAQCKNGWWFVSCNYDPPGNVIGQRPY